jgi:hypothetical protein
MRLPIRSWPAKYCCAKFASITTTRLRFHCPRQLEAAPKEWNTHGFQMLGSTVYSSLLNILGSLRGRLLPAEQNPLSLSLSIGRAPSCHGHGLTPGTLWSVADLPKRSVDRIRRLAYQRGDEYIKVGHVARMKPGLTTIHQCAASVRTHQQHQRHGHFAHHQYNCMREQSRRGAPTVDLPLMSVRDILMAGNKPNMIQ